MSAQIPNLSGLLARMSTVIAGDPQDRSDHRSRAALERLISGIEPWDELEAEQQATTTEWISTGAWLYRADRPDAPATHLVSYFVVLDEQRRELLLVAHRKAGLWLPTGGHVEPGAHPWDTVERECREELGIPAVPSTVSRTLPIFLTAAQTRGPHRHTDISLWFVLRADGGSITSWDQDEFSATRWLSPRQVLDERWTPSTHTCTGSPANSRRPWRWPCRCPWRHRRCVRDDDSGFTMSSTDRTAPRGRRCAASATSPFTRTRPPDRRGGRAARPDRTPWGL